MDMITDRPDMTPAVDRGRKASTQTNKTSLKFSSKYLTQFGSVYNEVSYIMLLQNRTLNNLSLVVRKPVFGVSNKVPHKPGRTAIEDG